MVRTVLHTVTATGKSKGAKRDFEQPLALPQQLDVVQLSSNQPDLSARHLCPRCPAGAKLGKNNWAGASFCCPARKTTTRTLARTTVKTVTKRRTKTVTKTPKITLKGQVYYDENKNGVYDSAVDTPIANTVVVIIASARTNKLARRAVTILGRGMTDSRGFFDILSLPLPRNTAVSITKDDEDNTPLKTFSTKADGSVDVAVPVGRPNLTLVSQTEFQPISNKKLMNPLVFPRIKPIVTPPPAISDNIATVVGTGEPGATIFLYANGVRVGEALVDAQGHFSVSSTSKLGSGAKTLTVTQADDRAAETKPVPAGAVTVLGPPVVGSKSVSGSIATISGTGKAGATVKVYANGTLVRTTTVAPNGSWSLQTQPLAFGSHAMTATQEDASGTSDPANGGSVSVAVKGPDAPTITSTTLNTPAGNTVRVVGTGKPGATIHIYANGVEVGTATVAPGGTFQVDTSVLDPGTYSITASQSDNVGMSSTVSGSKVTVAAPSVTTTNVVAPPSKTTSAAPKSVTQTPIVQTTNGGTIPTGATTGVAAQSTAAATQAASTTAGTGPAGASTTTALGVLVQTSSALPQNDICCPDYYDPRRYYSPLRYFDERDCHRIANSIYEYERERDQQQFHRDKDE